LPEIILLAGPVLSYPNHVLVCQNGMFLQRSRLMQQVIVIVSVIVLGFLTGQFLFRKTQGEIAFIRNWAIFVALRVCIPTSIGLAVWILPSPSVSLLILPVLGALVMLAGFVLGYLLSRAFHMTEPQRAVFAPAGGYINIGAVGALATFLLIGEVGLALLPLFKLFEEIIYYGFFFPYAARKGKQAEPNNRTGLKDPIILTMLSAVTLGFGLNFLGVSRPVFLDSASSILVPIGTFSLMVSVGLIFRLQTALLHWKPAIVLVVMKQLGLPLLVLATFQLLGINDLADGIALKVSVLIAFMPMAFIVILPANLYGLDQKLANACLFFSVSAFIVMLPGIAWLMTLL
jgi:predicted permease